MPPFLLHTTGHWRTPDGWLLRVDIMCGKWCATRFDPSIHIRDQVFGTDEEVHRLIALWAHRDA